MMEEDDDVLDIGDTAEDELMVEQHVVGAVDAPVPEAVEVGPSENELKLARRVIELEKERDELKVGQIGYCVEHDR